MGLENVDYISDFVITNPTKDDKRREGDDHLRAIKKGVKATFPNLDGPVTATPTELNYVVGVTANIQTQLDTKLESADLDFSAYARLDTQNTWQIPQRIVPLNLGNAGSAIVIDLDQSDSFIITLLEDCVLNFINQSEGQSVTVKLIQGAGAPHNISFLANAHFSFGLTPVLAQSQGKYDIISGKVIDGAIVFGFLADLSGV